MDRDGLLAHIRTTHFESGDRDRAVADARRIARFLERSGARSVVGIGSAFDPTRPFSRRSDIDLVVDGLPPRRFFSISAQSAAMTEFHLDLTAAESATPALLRVDKRAPDKTMTREETLLLRLAAAIESELASLAQLERELAGAPDPADTYSLRARGSILHDFSTGVERIFIRIASELDGAVPQAPQWHQELIRNMALAIPEVRPAVIEFDLAGKLSEYMSFRHMFRNVYGSVLDPARMQALKEQMPATLAAFSDQVEAFLAWMLGNPPA